MRAVMMERGSTASSGSNRPVGQGGTFSSGVIQLDSTKTNERGLQNFPRETMAQRIKRMRADRGMTQNDLAERCKLSRGFIVKAESGGFANMGILTAAEIAKQLGCTLDYMVYGVRTAWTS